MHSQQMASIALSIIGCIDYLAYGTIFTRVMFRPKKKVDVFFPARKAVDACLPGGGGPTTDNWVSPWLSRHVSSQYSPTGSTRFDVWEDKFTQYKAYVLRLETYYGLRRR